MRSKIIFLLALTAMVGGLFAPATAGGTDPARGVPAQGAVAPAAAGDLARTVLPARKKKRRNKPNKKWKVPTGPLFNNPMIERRRYVIERHVLRAIRNTPKGETITIAAYSMDRPVFGRELIAAYRRGVKVQVLLNDHQAPAVQRNIQRVIGNKTNRKSFLRRCVAGCRADKTEFNNLHSKFYLFSRTGKRRNVVMLGSHNMTNNAVRWQWNDLYTVAGKALLYKEYRLLFRDMKKDWDKRRATYTFCREGRACPQGDAHRFHTVVFPRYTTKQNDAVMDILNNVQCRYTDARGRSRRTILRLSMHTMRGNRGNYLARKLRDLHAQGCNLRVNYGLMGWHTKKKLGAPTSRGRVPLRSTGFDLNGDPETIERYTHHKYLVLKGAYRGRMRKMVWTGSTNWASLGTPQDEILVTIHGGGVMRKYMSNFNLMWKKPYSRNAYTTTYTTWRMVAGRWVAPQPRVTVQPDGVRPGATWEND